jgi:hypothetical protein
VIPASAMRELEEETSLWCDLPKIKSRGCHGQDNSRFAMIKRGHNPVSILTCEGKTILSARHLSRIWDRVASQKCLFGMGSIV